MYGGQVSALIKGLLLVVLEDLRIASASSLAAFVISMF